MKNSGKGKFNRRQFLRGASAALAAVSSGQMLFSSSAAKAATPSNGADNVVRVLGVSNGPPKSWEAFEKATGLKVEWTPMSDNVGLFLHEMMANDAGERYDLVTSLSGTYEILAEFGYLSPVDTARLPHWKGIASEIKQATPVVDGDKVWSIPFQINADSFAYFYEDLGEPVPPGEVSWKLLYDDPRTQGRVALDSGIYAILCCAIYLKYHGIVSIGDIASMTPSECYSVADYLIERKKAGQFRTLYKSYDEQVQLLTSREVIASSCWELAALDVASQGLKVAYAHTVEGYDKWAQNLMIPVQAKDRGASDKAHALINWMMGGAYAAEKSAFEGYVTPRPDLGVVFAKENGWSDELVTTIKGAQEKLNTKFSKSLFWDPGWFRNMEYYESAFSRFKNA